MAKRQTQWTQNPPWVTTWGFKSPPRHQSLQEFPVSRPPISIPPDVKSAQDRLRSYVMFNNCNQNFSILNATTMSQMLMH